MAQPIPNLFIIGPPRTGTSSVTKWIKQHPDVSGGRRKEPTFHASDLPSPTHITDRDEYLALWRGTESVPLRLDGSTWNLFSKVAASSIATMSPEAKLVVHLRDPVDLLASLHNHHVFLGMEPEHDFETAVFAQRPPDRQEFRRSIDYLEVARLAGQLKRYQEHFPQDRFTFVVFAMIERDPEEAYLTLLDNLGLRRVPLGEYAHMNPGRHERLRGANQRFKGQRSVVGRGVGKVVRKLNVSVGRPTVDRDVRRRILDHITPDIDELAEMIGRDLSDWKAV
jgi:hypothetical protein